MALYAHVCAMMMVVICSVLFLGFPVSATFVCGFVVCIISLYLYHHRSAAQDTRLSSAVQPVVEENKRLLKNPVSKVIAED
jgi:hypothetical protein